MPGSHTVGVTRLAPDVTNGRPPGTALEQASNTARGTPWNWRTCGCRVGALKRRRDTRTSTSLDVARRRGPPVHQDPGVPRTLGSFRGARKDECRRSWRLNKNPGDDAWVGVTWLFGVLC